MASSLLISCIHTCCKCYTACFMEQLVRLWKHTGIRITLTKITQCNDVLSTVSHIPSPWWLGGTALYQHNSQTEAPRRPQRFRKLNRQQKLRTKKHGARIRRQPKCRDVRKQKAHDKLAAVQPLKSENLRIAVGEVSDCRRLTDDGADAEWNRCRELAVALSTVWQQVADRWRSRHWVK